MKSARALETVLLLLTLLPSCIENIEMKGEDPYYVVDCLLTTESQQGLIVKYRTNNLPIYDIEASICDLTTGEAPFPFSPVENNILSGHIDFTPVPGHEYLLTVQVDSKTTLTARTVFPFPAEMTYQNGEGAWDSPYCAQVTVQKKSPNPTWMWGAYLAPSDFSPQVYNSYLTAEIACDYPGTDRFNLINRKLSVYCTDESGANMHDKILRMNLDDNASFSIFPYSASKFFLENPERNEIHAICVSEELDRFLRETVTLDYIQGGGVLIEQDPDSWFKVYDHNNYYSNIQGGTGIFGAYVPCMMTRL